MFQAIGLLMFCNVFVQIFQFPIRPNGSKDENLTKYVESTGWPLAKLLSEIPFHALNALNATEIEGVEKAEIVEKIEILSLKRKPKHYNLHRKWNKSKLHYGISKYSLRLPKREIDHIMANAFKQWEDASNSTLSFHQVPEGLKVDIDIRFEERDHGDEGAFDGPGGVLAHGHFPEFGGSIHFDDDEDWANSWRVNLLGVSLHEIGHALGLGHPSPGSYPSIMSSYSYNKTTLEEDDIAGLRALYVRDEKMEKECNNQCIAWKILLVLELFSLLVLRVHSCWEKCKGFLELS